MRRIATGTIVGALLAAGSIGCAAAQVPAQHLPPEQRQNGIAYVTGGQLQGQVRLFEETADRYPLSVELVQWTGQREAMLPGAQVTLRSAAGKKVLSAMVDGPFLLARVPPGRYRISATYSGKTVERDFVLEPHTHQRVVMEWTE